MGGEKDWSTEASSLTLPPFAGPGQARIVIGPDLPPPLNTYTFTDQAGYGSKYSGGIIFYGSGDDTTYNYLCTVDNTTGPFSAVHFGEVQSGSVRQVSAGVPAVQIWSTDGSSVATLRYLTGGAVHLEAIAGTGFFSITSAAAILATAAGNFDFNVNRMRIGTTTAYMLTQQQTNVANASLVLSTTQTAVSGTLMTLPTVKTNALYRATIVCDVDMTALGTTTALGQLRVDGTSQSQQAVYECNGTDDRATVTQTFSGTLAATGNHTFEMYGNFTVASGTVQFFSSNTALTVSIYES